MKKLKTQEEFNKKDLLIESCGGGSISGCGGGSSTPSRSISSCGGGSISSCGSKPAPKKLRSCGGGSISSCGGGYGSSEPTADEVRRTNIKKNRNTLIDELEHTCDECYTELTKNAKFCQECGTKAPEGLVWD